MFGKMVLPLLGSSPSVWITCMVFFQAALLLGYLYSHLSILLLGVKKQFFLHIFLLCLPLLFLPISIPLNVNPPEDRNPVFWQLLLMLSTVGIPFFVLSCSAPMLQKWFSNTSHKSGSDPYFLYVGSNLGSMIALLGYPFLIEPYLKLMQQTNFWMYGYYLIILLTISCGIFLWIKKSDSKESVQKTTLTEASISTGQRILWIALSFVPSSLMLGLTTYLSTDIASVPLLWVIPLAIYLLTFVLVFAQKPLFTHELLVKLMPILVIPMVVQFISAQMKIVLLSILIHLLTFFVACMVCHGELAKKRPSPSHLTEFYLWISVGGFLGGVFNAIIAPLIFKTVVEYQIALVLAYLLRPKLIKGHDSIKDKLFDIVIPFLLGAFITTLALFLRSLDKESKWFNDSLLFVLFTVLILIFSFRPMRFGLAFASILLSCSIYSNSTDKILSIKRSFFGVHKVVLDQTKNYKYLIHGRTIHGAQKVSDANLCNPLTYYYPSGPIGQLLRTYGGIADAHIGIVGLGAGSLACYGMTGEQWDFFEIDPAVKYFATNRNYFTFLNNSKAKCDVILGDGRLSLNKSADKTFDFIVLDAFTSDSIPMHLLTKEALILYLKKLKDTGILAFHISSQYLDLKPVLAGGAVELGCTAYIEEDIKINKEDHQMKKEPSIWVVVAPDKSNLKKIISDSRWKPLLPKENFHTWTDDFSNILSVFIWKK